jgi:hypothetical protein
MYDHTELFIGNGSKIRVRFKWKRCHVLRPVTQCLIDFENNARAQTLISNSSYHFEEI